VLSRSRTRRGVTFRERIAQGPIPIDEALPIFLRIAGALEAAHEKGILHRDLKPANIKVSQDGKVKVLDFVLANAVDQWKGRGLSGSQSPSRQQSRLHTHSVAGRNHRRQGE
jgi:serine/threonine protein kinase